jgi:hypothetical protein
LRYLRWGGDGEAVRADKANGLIMFETLTLPQRQVHAVLVCVPTKRKHEIQKLKIEESNLVNLARIVCFHSFANSDADYLERIARIPAKIEPQLFQMHIK